MSVFILLGKKYDTDKMELVSEVKKWYKDEVLSHIANDNIGKTYDCKLYRSKNQHFLLTHNDGCRIYGEAITVYEAQGLLMKYDYKKYEEIWGEIEEA